MLTPVRMPSRHRTPSFARLFLLPAPILLSLFTSTALLAADPSAPQLRTRNGGAFSLDSLKGQVVVLDFWASWCIPCRTSFPYLDSLQARYESKGLKVVGLSLEDDDDAVNAFLESMPVRFTILRDPTGSAGEAFGVVAMPTTFLLDRDGKVAARFDGGEKKAQARLEAAVSALLTGGSLAPDAGVQVARGLEATGGLKAWRRGYLADPIMSFDTDPIARMFREHIHASKEGAAGDGGPSGGGCGCN